MDRSMIGKVGEPIAHDPPRKGEGDEAGEADQLQEFAGKKTGQAGNGSAQNLADAKLLGALFGCIRSKTEKTKAGDKYRERSEEAGQFADPGFAFKAMLKFCVNEFDFDRVAGVFCFNYSGDLIDGCGNVDTRFEAKVEAEVIGIDGRV